jgi:hypothetical protein
MNKLSSVQKMLLCFLMFCAILLPRMGESREKVLEGYTASLINMAGVGKGPIQIKILIYSYTTKEEFDSLAGALQKGGQDAVARGMDKMEKGRIAPNFSTGNDVNYIRTFDTDKGRVIRFVSNRPMSFMELRNSGRSTDYPFGIIELVIAKDGTIDGSVIGAAKIKINKDNALEVESYGTEPLRLQNIRKMD